MADDLEIIISAIDQASQVFQEIISNAMDLGSEVSSSVDSASTDFDEMGSAAEDAANDVDQVGNAIGGIDGSGASDAAGGIGELGDAADEADSAVDNLSADLSIINAGMLLQTAEQIGQIGGNAEGMAQEMNEAAITVGQLATQTGIAEPKLVDMINEITNATFPHDEAMMYVKSLDQIGVSAENLGKSATDLDKINDAFGMGAETVNSLGQELSVLGVDMNNVSSAFNALAYANANTVGGMDNYYNFLRKYDAQFKELGFNVDQASVIIAGATQKFGGGRAALSGLSDALKESNGDTRKLEEALDLEAGSIENATQLTGQYEGQLQQMANEEAEHKTILDQVNAAVEDLKLKYSGILTPLASFVGMIGEVGSFGMQVRGLKELATTFTGLKEAVLSSNIVTGISNGLQKTSAVITGALSTAKAALLGTQTAVTAEEVGAAAAHASGAASIAAETVATDAATTSFGALAIAEGVALWPILAIVAAIAALGLAFYEIGKYFGWWTDFGSMLESIKSGVMRLWDAFINHPDVQAVIHNIQTAWNNFTKTLGEVISKVLEFFGVHQGGEFDAIGAVINGVGAAWETLKSIVSPIINIFRNIDGAIQTVNSKFPLFSTIITTVLGPIGVLYNALRTIVCILLGCSPGIVPALQTVYDTFTNVLGSVVGIVSTYVGNIVAFFQPLIDTISNIVNFLVAQFMPSWNLILGTISSVGNHISLLITVFNQFLNGQISFSSMLQQVWNIIKSMFKTVFNTIVTLVRQWANKIATLAKQAASKLLNNVVNGIKNLPTKIRTIITNAYNRIKSGMDNWVVTAKKKAKQTMDGAVNALRNLPSNIGKKITSTAKNIASNAKAWVTNAKEKAESMRKAVVDKVSNLVTDVVNEFASLPGKIRKAIGDAVNAAKNAIAKMPAAVKKVLGIASPGFIQRAIVAEFTDTVTRIADTASKATSAAKKVAHGIRDGFGSVDLDTSLDTYYGDIKDKEYIVNSKEEQELTVNVKHEHDYQFTGLPDSVSAKEVASMINEANKNDDWVKQLTSNPRFQHFDLKEKTRLTRKNKRILGV